MYHVRACTDYIRRLIQNFPVVIISGARQVGKTTFLKTVFGSQFSIVTFDPLQDIGGARSDPDLFLLNRRPPLILDEIQYAPEVVPALKRRIDEDRAAGQYIITGSQQWEVIKRLAESLAGRCVFYDMHSFSLGEAANIYKDTKSPKFWLNSWLTESIPETTAAPALITGLPTLYEQLYRGFLPEANTMALEFLSEYFEGYIRTYLERDVRMIDSGIDLSQFRRFYQLVTLLTGREINHAQVGRELGLDRRKASHFLQALRSTFQWFEVPAFHNNQIKRISKKPVGYIADTGLACAVQLIAHPEVLGGHPQFGMLFQTAVFLELVKQCSLIKPSPRIFHWRAYSGAELDFVVEWNNCLYPIEVKAASHPGRKAARSFESFRQAFKNRKIAKGLILAPTNSSYYVTETELVLPWNARDNLTVP